MADRSRRSAGRARASVPGRVELELADGRTVATQVAHGLGHPDKPLSWDRVVAKFHECLDVSAVDVSPAAADEVVAATAELESVPDIRVLADRSTLQAR